MARIDRLDADSLAVGMGIPHYVKVGANASDSEGAAGHILAASSRFALLARVALKARQARARARAEHGCAAAAVKARAWAALRLHCVVAGGKCRERHPQQAVHHRRRRVASAASPWVYPSHPRSLKNEDHGGKEDSGEEEQGGDDDFDGAWNRGCAW